MARTNKMGILKKKQQLQKQKKVIGDVANEMTEKKSYGNPRGHDYVRFLRSGKYVCDATSVREDPDGYRIIRRPNSGEVEFVSNVEGYGYRKFVRKQRQLRTK